MSIRTTCTSGAFTLEWVLFLVHNISLFHRLYNMFYGIMSKEIEVITIGKKKQKTQNQDVKERESVSVSLLICTEGCINEVDEKKVREQERIICEGARVALPVFMDEYAKELDRKIAIENKITSLITIEIAILTVFMPIIPFEEIKKHFASKVNGVVIATTVANNLLIIAIVLMAVAFVILMCAIRVQTYNKVDIVQLEQDKNLNQTANAVEIGLCGHYKDIILFNSDLNDDKAKKYKIGLPLTIASFFCLIIGTIILKCLG